ncbi:PpiC-Type Peptidyl-Prolyl Cis-Trans Isomerase [Blattabacterium sp. (Nauphoeta cinerea)]|uniref:SurA N-terminal domain-containing protein n=1 Tax=Blattabacterium sp. (Nauphoeta cinerea) TaxID=1316444 RepID=UPI0003B002DC|nr:SurA N-terminal domain-containing protein [Blattabacterium sp. (Nauphoeta cinerea)]AGW85872.1 PpiC-Type Peptidyl-Prolyl Cis-Trans Isomerase [Blattabacterium sp. (Nauphoeta cinerea)]
MNFLEKIRKNTWLVFFFISISLIFFVLDPNMILKFFTENSTIIGKVNGDNILIKEYVDCFQFLKRFRENEPDHYLKNDAWKLLVHEKVLNQEAKKLGIQSTKIDFWKAIEKQSIYSKIIDFQNDQGKMNMKKFKLYLKNLEKLPSHLTPQVEEEKNIWSYEKKSISKRIVAKKYVEMLMYGFNTSFVEAKLNYKDKNLFSIIDYIFFPYSEIEKKYYKIKSHEIHDFIQKNKFLYKKENLRNLSFVVFRSYPSLDDEKNMDFKMKKLFQKFKFSNHNSIIVSNQSEKPFDSNFYLKKNLPVALQHFVDNHDQVGNMFGPVKENNVYIMAKLTGKKMIYHSVLSSHILISHKDSVRFYKNRTKKDAEKIAKKIYGIVTKNPNQFHSLIIKKSDDIRNAKKNKGNLGWIKYDDQNEIFKENKGRFDFFSSKNKKGTIGLAETKFGYHIIRIDNVKDIKPVYQFAVIIKTLIPSKKTEDLLYQKIIQFLKENKNSSLNEFINNARKKRYETIFLKEIKSFQWNIDDLNTELDKEIINWSYEKNRKEGDTKIFYTSNKDYIIVFLSKIQKKGYPIEEIKNNIIPLLINKKIDHYLSSIINNKYESLEKIALRFSRKINKYHKINFYQSMIENYQEPKVVGYAFSSKLHKTSKPILGEKGIFFIRPLKRFNTSKKISYFSSEMESLNINLRKNVLEKIGDVLIEKSNIKDYRKNI